MERPGTSVDPIVGHNFTGKAQESDVSFSALSLLELPYITLEHQNEKYTEETFSS